MWKALPISFSSDGAGCLPQWTYYARRSWKKYNLSQFDFSHNYLYFWDIFWKVEFFLENIIANRQATDGRPDSSGILQSSCRRRRSMEPLLQCCREIRVVPQEVMPETAHSTILPRWWASSMKDCGWLWTARNDLLPAKKGRNLQTLKWLRWKVYRILALCLGELLISLRGDIRIKDREYQKLTITRRNSSTKKSPRPTTVLPTISWSWTSDQILQNIRNSELPEYHRGNQLDLSQSAQRRYQRGRPASIKTTSRCMPPAM